MKRVIDIVVSAIGLLLVLPLLSIVVLCLYLEDRGPIFYVQRRAGRDGRPFDLLKLRSMRVNSLPVGAVGQVDPDHPLVTRTGRLLRRSKLDEVPQLLNVLRGEMSLVGPRPTVPEQVVGYDDFERRRLLVRPGMTGWAQVNGNTRLSWRERIQLDSWYVDHRSVLLDLRILVSTATVVIHGERVNEKAVQEAREHADSLDRSRR